VGLEGNMQNKEEEVMKDRMWGTGKSILVCQTAAQVSSKGVRITAR